jgi:aspartyl-tRNA(Asn)/glutamyl-tRNA(Gln) amidotransferase subunit A
MSASLAGTAADLATRIRRGDCSAREVTAACLERIAAHDGGLRAFVGVAAERALRAADRIDDRRARGEALGALAGVPIAWKDNLLVEGELATAGSRILEGFRAPYTATALARLERADAVLLGRTNLDEFGMGSSTESSAHGPTRNPVAPHLVPGGSSGGSAAAVAAGFCPIAIGSDTGGSVRQPASFCGVTGLKPGYGRVSRFGLIAYASSLDCVGAIARTAEDLALWLDAVAGRDDADPTTLPDAPPVFDRVVAGRDLRGLRVLAPREWHADGIDGEVLRRTEQARSQLAALGAAVGEGRLPAARHAVKAYYLLATGEAASNLARYDGVHFGPRRAAAGIDPTTATRTWGFGREVQLRILLGTFALSYGYSEQFHDAAERARAAVRADFARAFERCDLVVAPTSPIPPFPIGETETDPLRRYLVDALTVPASLAGLPALSLPCGTTADGRPIGLQLIAPAGKEDVLLRAAHVFQLATTHHLARPIA